MHYVSGKSFKITEHLRYPQYRQFDDPDYIRAEVDGAQVARHLFFDPKPHSIRKPTDRVASSLWGKKTCKRVKFMHDLCLIFMIFVWYPPKKYLTNFFPLRFFQPFFRRHSIHPKKKTVRLDFRAGGFPAFWDPGLWCTQRHLSQQMGWVGWVVGRPCWHPALIFLASNYLQRPPTQWSTLLPSSTPAMLEFMFCPIFRLGKRFGVRHGTCDVLFTKKNS